MNHDDLALILERVVTRARSEGNRADRTTRTWADTIRAASYGDKGGNRWEEVTFTDDGEQVTELMPVPHDPTGDAATDPDQTAQLHTRLRKAMSRLRSAAAEYEHILDQASPDPKKHPRIPDDKIDDDRWCRSCRRNAGHLEPVATHPDGRVKYAGSCRWCHDFRAEYGRDPDPELLRKRHAGQRITTVDVERAARRKKAG